MYLQNHAQLINGQILQLPTSTPGGASTLPERRADLQLGLRNSRNPDHADTHEHFYQHQHLPQQHVRLHNTGQASYNRGEHVQQNGSYLNLPKPPALVVINRGHISRNETQDVRLVHNGSGLNNQMNSPGYLSREATIGSKSLPTHTGLFKEPGSHSSGAFHVVPQSKRPEGHDRKPSGSSSGGLHKPTLTFVPPPAVPVLQVDHGRAESLAGSQQHGRACNGVGQQRENRWVDHQQHQEYEHQRSVQQQEQQHYGHQRALLPQKHQRSLQQQQQQQQEHQRSLQQQQHEHQRSLLQQQQQQHEHQRVLQEQEQQQQQYEHQRSLQQQEQQQQQQYEHQRSLQQQQQEQQQQYEHQRSLQQKRHQQMISNHNETASPFGMVTNSSHHHTSGQQHHHHQHPNHHYPPQQQHENLPTVSSHPRLRPSAFSPTSSASLALSHLILETKPENSNIPLILISSPPGQQVQSRHHASSPHSSLLSPKPLEDASVKLRTLAPATLQIPSFRTSHPNSRSENPAPSGRHGVPRPDLPPRPVGLSRSDRPARPVSLSRSEPPPYLCRHIDFEPIDKPQKTYLDVDKSLDKTPPPAPPHRISSTLQLLPSHPSSASQEERTPPLISPTVQKPSSHHRDAYNVTSLERPACVDQSSSTTQLPTCHRRPVTEEGRTSFSTCLVYISPTLQKPWPHGQGSNHTSSTSPVWNASTLQLPSSRRELLSAPQEENTPALTSSIRISPTQQSSSRDHRESHYAGQVEKPEPSLRIPSTHQHPSSHHPDRNRLSPHKRTPPPALPARVSSTLQTPSSHNRDLGLSLPAVTTSPPAPPLLISTTFQSQSFPKELLNSVSLRVTSPCSTATNDRPSLVSRDNIQPTLATVEDLSNVRLKSISDPCTRPRALSPLSPGEVISGSVNYRLRHTAGKFSNIYTSETTTPPSCPVIEDLDELPPPPPPHELVLSPEDLAILAVDSSQPHQHSGSPSLHLPKPQAHVPAGELNSSLIYHQHTKQFQLRHPPIQSPTHQDSGRSIAGTLGGGNSKGATVGCTYVLERPQTESMSNMDFEIPDDIDLSQCPGLVEITQSIPNWKRDMVEKKNQEKIEEYVKTVLKEREQEAKWKNIPAWKKKILQKKDDEEATASSTPPPKTKAASKKPETDTDNKKPETKAELKKPAKKPPPPPPKDIKEDYASMKPKGDIVPAALSIDPEELAAMPPWKRELLFKRDKVPVTFSNEYNPEDDSAPSDYYQTTS